MRDKSDALLVLQAIEESGMPVERVPTVSDTLEDVFVGLVGKMDDGVLVRGRSREPAADRRRLPRLRPRLHPQPGRAVLRARLPDHPHRAVRTHLLGHGVVDRRPFTPRTSTTIPPESVAFLSALNNHDATSTSPVVTPVTGETFASWLAQQGR